MTRLTRRGFVGGLAAAAVRPVLSGCQRGNREEDEMTTHTGLASVDLPPPAESGIPIEVALRRGRSVREFTDQPLAAAGRPSSVVTGAVANTGGPR